MCRKQTKKPNNPTKILLKHPTNKRLTSVTCRSWPPDPNCNAQLCRSGLRLSYAIRTCRRCNRRWFRSESKGDRATLALTMEQFDLKNTGGIDYVEWSNRMRLDNLAEITV